MQPRPISSTDFAVHVAPSPEEGMNVTIFGELDLVTVDRVKTALRSAVEGAGPVEVDLRACGFVDSRGIAALVQTALELREEGRMMILLGVQPRVERILQVAGLTGSELLEVRPEGSGT